MKEKDDAVMNSLKENEWTGFLASLGNFSDDFFKEERKQGVSEKREEL